MRHTYRITIARPGHRERVHIKEFADIFACAAWAQRQYPATTVRIAIEQVNLLAPLEGQP